MTEPFAVLVLVRAVPGPDVGRAMTGVVRTLGRAGGRVIAVRTHGAPGTGAAGADPVAPFTAPVAFDQVAGALVMPGAAAPEHLAVLRASGLPYVVLDSAPVLESPYGSAPVVLPGDEEGAAAAVAHLVAHGHRRIAFLGVLDRQRTADRLTGYRSAVAAAGLAHQPGWEVALEEDTIAAGERAASRIATMHPRPTAVLVGSDEAAYGVLARLSVLGIPVPQEIAVVGFGDDKASPFATPSLTSVRDVTEDAGALAASLLLGLLRGEDPGAGPHLPDASAIAARGSCGCTDDLLGEPGRPVRQVVRGAAELRTELRSLLHATLESQAQRYGGPVPDGGGAAGSGGPGRAVAVDVARASVDELLAADGLGTALQMRRLLTHLHQLRMHPDDIQQVIDAVTEYVQQSIAEFDADGRGATVAPKAARLSGALWQLQASTMVRRYRGLERAMREQFGVAFTLLDRTGHDPRELAWLAGTRVRAAALALWQGPPAHEVLRVVGRYDPAGLLAADDGLVPARSFPPRDLVGLVRPQSREACFVVPVRDHEHEWGVLVLVGKVDTTSAREAYHHWATLLASVLSAEETERAVRASEERHAHAARAARDGLWEQDLVSGQTYVSDRGRTLLCLPDDVPSGRLDLDAVTSRVDVRDVDALEHALADARRRADEPVEVEVRVPCGETGQERWVLLRAMGVAGPDGQVTRLVGSVTDIDQRRALEEELRRGALLDPITGLPNRRLFLDRLGVAVERARRHPAARFAVVFLDLDGFKLVNDSLGHQAGDRLLAVVGTRLREHLRAVDTAARFGGDEFAVLLDDLDTEAVLSTVRRLQAAVAQPARVDGHDLVLTASFGIASSATGYGSADDVLRDADLAMYHAKATERGSVALFDPLMHARATARLQARGEVRTALTDRQLVVHYQPVVSLVGEAVGMLTAFEALVRWAHPERGLLSPAEFLPAMEDARAMPALGRWLLDEVCAQIAVWRRTAVGPVTVAVNVSHQEFWSADLHETVAAALVRHDVPARCLVLEITESVVMSDAPAARALMDRLHGLGVRLHVDDFGTGHSSLQALRTFPVDALKIDSSFVRELGHQEQTTELVRVILAMGDALGLEVVAEGVETAAQAERLAEMGCTRAQGWLFAPAVDGERAGAMLGTTLTPTQPVRPSRFAALERVERAVRL